MTVVLACATQVVQATTPKKPSRNAPVAVWDKEPTSFIGIELGKPLSGNFPSCPMTKAVFGTFVDERYRDPCVTGDGNKLALWNGPDLGFGYGNRILLREGKVESVTLTTLEDNYAALKQLLITRYGPPSSTSVSEWETDQGLKVTSEESVWRGSNVSILLSARYDTTYTTINGWTYKSAVVVKDNALTKAAEDTARAKQTDAASKL